MPNDESITDVLSASVGNLPVPAQATFLKAASRLTGGLIDIPVAYVERWSQSIRDTTAAKSTVAQALAKSVSTELSDDELTMAAVKQVYLPEVIRKTRNRIEIARKTAEELSGQDDDRVLEDPDEDWINAFARLGEDASSERMQKLFARILAGEMRSKGAFSMSTLRIVSELSQADAATFQSIWDKSCGDFIRYDKGLRGSEWVKITRLRDIGLLSPIDSGIWQPEFTPVLEGVSPWSIGPNRGDFALVVGMQRAANKFFNVINFTRVGLEVAQLLAPPDYTGNLRELGKSLIDSNVRWIVLTAGEDNEVLYAEEGASAPAMRMKK